MKKVHLGITRKTNNRQVHVIKILLLFSKDSRRARLLCAQHMVCVGFIDWQPYK